MKVFTTAGDTSLFGLGAVAIFGMPINYLLATLALAYALLRIAMVSVEFYWKWKDRKREQENRVNGTDGSPARADSGNTGRDDPAH